MGGAIVDAAIGDLMDAVIGAGADDLHVRGDQSRGGDLQDAAIEDAAPVV